MVSVVKRLRTLVVFYPKATKTYSNISFEVSKGKAASLRDNPTILFSLRETAGLFTTHYSRVIEGKNAKSAN